MRPRIDMGTCPYGLRVVGGKWARRALVDHGRAFAGYCRCDPKANITMEAFLTAFRFGDDFRARFEDEGSERGYDGVCGADRLWFDIDRADDLDAPWAKRDGLARSWTDTELSTKTTCSFSIRDQKGFISASRR